MENNPCMTFEDVNYSYGSIPALKDARFAVPKGSLCAMVGPNGGGKSTIIKLLTGIHRPQSGRITITKGHTISYVAQDNGFDTSFPMTVGEMVLTGTLCPRIRPFYRYTPHQRRQAEAALDRVGLEGFSRRGIHQLSGGQLKRAVIARALSSNADVLILDEPDGSLDVDATRELYAILASLKGETTILVASHHINEVLDVADHALYVHGSVSSFDAPQRLKEKLMQGITL